ncbi:MAG TPA: IS1595 family transposase [Planctomycetota bacterium]|nr:IS1595 family transposase [Planctomycetota bacterium]
MNTKEKVKVLREAATDEAKAIAFFEARRWPDGVACPRCGSVGVHAIIGKDGQRERHYRWTCKDCKRRFTVRTGTVFEETRLPMRVWAHAYWRCCASKKGVSALQIKRETGIAYRHALFLLNRIRFGMADTANPAPLTGTVECDETYVGGKPRVKGKGMREKWSSKVPVVGMVERGGKARMRVVARVTAKTLRAELEAHVAPSAHLMTDEHPAYGKIGARFFAHDVVKHSAREYARGEAGINRAESLFAILKRKVYGTHHAISREHLHRYVAEAEFLFNTRKLDDSDRVSAAIKAGEGKRLTYREPDTAAA